MKQITDFFSAHLFAQELVWHFFLGGGGGGGGGT